MRFWPFSSQRAALLPADHDEPPVASMAAARRAARRLSPKDRELASYMELNGVAQGIEREMRKAMTYQQFQAMEDATSDDSGYFGREFDIRSTPGRIKGAYTKEPWMFASASLIARTLATVPLRCYKPGTDEAIEKHPLQALLDAGTPNQSPLEARWVSYLDLILGGNFFLIIEEDYKTLAGLGPVELVELVFDRDRCLVNAIDVYGFGGASQKTARFPIEYVVHAKLPNPFTPYYGMSLYTAAARPILLDRYKNEYEMAFYLRGATAAGIVETTEDLSKNRFKRLMATFEQTFTGRANWWRTLFMPKGSTWKSGSLTMAEAQHLEGLRENRKTILAVIGVPPSAVGLVEDVNRATAETQERYFWTNTIVPLSLFVSAAWNQSYLVKTKFKGTVEVRPDFSGVEAVEGFVSALQERAKAMEPYFWIDEIREKVWGEEPAPNDAGRRFVAEVRGANQGTGLNLNLSQGPAETPPPPAAPPRGIPKAVAIPEGFGVVCVIFQKVLYPEKDDAVLWARDHGYTGDDVAETSTTWRLQQQNPDGYTPESLHEIVLCDGVAMILGELKKRSEEASKAHRKATATTSQNRIETRLGADLDRAVETYFDDLLADARQAILHKTDVRRALEQRAHLRLESYLERARATYEAALERGFSAASAQVRDARQSARLKAGTPSGRFPGLSETDKQAVDALRERTRTGRRRLLEERNISAFRGLDETQTENVMATIEQMETQGRTFEEQARELRGMFEESYRNQARTIVRTEILTAVSQGLAWNHDVLGQVFSEVEKEWLHQGDSAINKDAREEHVAFEELGPIGGNETWKAPDGSELRFPRDPNASAGQVINCRCTMVSVIPDSATSNADAILEST